MIDPVIRFIYASILKPDKTIKDIDTIIRLLHGDLEIACIIRHNDNVFKEVLEFLNRYRS